MGKEIELSECMRQLKKGEGCSFEEALAVVRDYESVYVPHAVKEEKELIPFLPVCIP